MEPGSIAITGHRVYPDRGVLLRGLDALSAKHYYFGGALGIDSDALEYISKTQPMSSRTVVVPNRVIDQPAIARAMIGQYATKVIQLRNAGPERFMIRNRYLVDNTSKTVAFYDFRGSGGTYNTIQYAQLKGKLGVVNSLREFKIEEFTGQTREQFGNWVKQMKSFNVDLSCIKMIILQMIFNILKITIQQFCAGIGYLGVKTLEQLWSL